MSRTKAVKVSRGSVEGEHAGKRQPLRDETVQILRGDSRHVTVSIGTSAPRQSPLQFENVADPAALLAALVQAGAQTLPSPLPFWIAEFFVSPPGPRVTLEA